MNLASFTKKYFIFKDVYRELDQMIGTVEDLERWRDRIYDAIHRGAYYVSG